MIPSPSPNESNTRRVSGTRCHLLPLPGVPQHLLRHRLLGCVETAETRIKDMKARRIGGLLGCPRKFFLFGALDQNSTAQMRRVTTGLHPCIPHSMKQDFPGDCTSYANRRWRVAGEMDSRHAWPVPHGGRHACQYDSPTKHLHMHPVVFVSSFPRSSPGNPVPKPRHHSIAGAFCILHATDFPDCNAASGSAPTPPAALPPPLLPVLAPTRAPCIRRRPPSPSLPPVMRRIRAGAPWIDPLRAPAFILHPIDGVSGPHAAGGVSASACRGWWRH